MCKGQAGKQSVEDAYGGLQARTREPVGCEDQGAGQDMDVSRPGHSYKRWVEVDTSQRYIKHHVPLLGLADIPVGCLTRPDASILVMGDRGHEKYKRRGQGSAGRYRGQANGPRVGRK